MNDVVVEPVRNRRERELFLRMPWRFYREHPAWVPPLLFDVRAQLDPRKGDFFRHSEGEFFLARRGSEIVGRIAALHNRRHLAAHADGAGFFGFFECENAPATAAALLGAAERWLRARGLAVARGPANFSIQDEAGVLLDGFEHAPMAGMAYTPPYYRALLEAAGYVKAKDLEVWRIDRAGWRVDEIERCAKLARHATRDIVIRPLNMRAMPDEAARMEKIFAEAWRDNWGAQPISQAEFLKYASQYRLFIDPRLILFAERAGEPLAMAAMIGNVNEIVQRIDGKLLPLGWLHLLRGRHRVRSLRLFLMGVRQEARRFGLPALFIQRYHEILRDIPHVELLEFSWILEENHQTIRLLERFGCRKAQTLRLYEKALA